jgi:hypothetical protein
MESRAQVAGEAPVLVRRHAAALLTGDCRCVIAALPWKLVAARMARGSVNAENNIP